jgi:hypothetical protein
VDGSLMWFVATITLRRFVAGSGRRPPHQEPTYAIAANSAKIPPLVGGNEQRY